MLHTISSRDVDTVGSFTKFHFLPTGTVVEIQLTTIQSKRNQYSITGNIMKFFHLLFTSLVTLLVSPGHSFQALTRPALAHRVVANGPSRAQLAPLHLASSDSSSNSPASASASVPSRDILLLQTCKTLWRNSWTSWWCQLPLSIVSTITLLFARSIIRGNNSNAVQKEAIGLFLTGTGEMIPK